MTRQYIPRTITITPEQDKFLHNNPELNFSAIVRRKIDELIRKTKR